MTGALQNLFLNNWQAKIAALLVAIAVYYIVKTYQSGVGVRTTPIPGESEPEKASPLTSPIPGPDTTTPGVPVPTP